MLSKFKVFYNNGILLNAYCIILNEIASNITCAKFKKCT